MFANEVEFSGSTKTVRAAKTPVMSTKGIEGWKENFVWRAPGVVPMVRF